MKKQETKSEDKNKKVKFTVTNEDEDNIKKAQKKLGTLSQAEAMRQAMRKGLKIILEEDT